MQVPARIHGRSGRLPNLVLIIKSGLPGTGNSAYSDTSNADFTITATGALPVLTVSASPASVIVGTPTAVKFTVKNQTSGLSLNGAAVSLSGAATGSGVTGADGTATISVNAATAGTITATATRNRVYQWGDYGYCDFTITGIDRKRQPGKCNCRDTHRG